MKYSKLYYILRITSWLIVGVLAFVAYSQVGKEMVWKEKIIIENTLEMLETPRDKTADVEDNTKKKDSKNKNKKKKKGNYIVKYVDMNEKHEETSEGIVVKEVNMELARMDLEGIHEILDEYTAWTEKNEKKVIGDIYAVLLIALVVVSFIVYNRGWPRIISEAASYLLFYWFIHLICSAPAGIMGGNNYWWILAIPFYGLRIASLVVSHGDYEDRWAERKERNLEARLSDAEVDEEIRKREFEDVSTLGNLEKWKEAEQISDDRWNELRNFKNERKDKGF